jgi:cytidylate kinase
LAAMKNAESTAEISYRNLFEKYFSQVLNDKQIHEKPAGPFISISRDFGCLANPLADRLSKELTSRYKALGIKREWKWLNKQILEESAKALEVSPSKIKYIFQSQQKTMIDEIVSAMSTRYYKSDKKIRKTITEVIRSIAKSGDVIIVGRGGVAFGKDNPNSLHIKLIAPIEWRVERISKNYNKTQSEALVYVLDVDQERKYLIDSFLGYETDLSLFDLVFNRKTLSEDEILSAILNVVDRRGMLSSS